MPDPTVEAFFERLAEAWRDTALLRVTLGAPRLRDADVRQVVARPVAVKAGPRLAMVWRHARRDLTRTVEFAEGESLLRELLGTAFSSGSLHTRAASWNLEFRPGRNPVLHRLPPALAPGSAPGGGFPPHDAPKNGPLAADRPWLRALGVTGSSGKVLADRTDKFRQISRYVEILGPLLTAAPLPAEGPLTLLDLGCGKGYLTFAAFERLQALFPGRPVRAVGLEERPDLAAAAEGAARAGGFGGLTFQAGRIDAAELPRADVVVALHACDTATDDALARAVACGAALAVTAPCCHREIRPLMDAAAPWRMPLGHGILRERQAEWLTDALRAALLEWAGYEARVMEFVSPEHTAKNLLLAGIRRPSPALAAEAAETVRGLAGAFGVRSQALAEHLKFPWAAPSPAVAHLGEGAP